MSEVDVTMALAFICPAAQYFGSLTDNSEDAYGLITWMDERAQPSWADIEAAAIQMQKPDIQAITDEACAIRDGLLSVAAIRVAPLQDAVDMGVETSAETAALTAWKLYRVELSRIDQQEGFPVNIAWPKQPA